MDIQFYGANCVSVSFKGARIVIDDNLAELGGKSVAKSDDVVLFTAIHEGKPVGRMQFDGPGEYEVSDISVTGIPVRSHMDEPGTHGATMFKLAAGDLNVLVTGHVYPELSDRQLEEIGIVDVMLVPVGGNGYTVDPVGALKLLRAVEPKIVVPTHYDDAALKFPVPQQDLKHALTEMSMEPKESVSKLKLKPGELSDVTQLIVLEKS